MPDLRSALAALALAVALVSWLHGLVSYARMVRHRHPGVSPLGVRWSAAELTPQGMAHRRRALRSFAVSAVALLVVLLSALGARGD